MIDPTPPPPDTRGPRPGTGTKKPWSKPVLSRLDEVVVTRSGPKTPTHIQSYEAAPSGPYPTYMPQSVTQSLVS